ncbi:MAG: radical SAM protein [Pseudomonadota bacterium]
MTYQPRLNEDGISVKGCSYIYAPRGQALEYSALAANPYRGCGHKCAYCYVPRAIKIDRKEFDAGAQERPEFIERLTKDARKYQALGVDEQVMLSFSTDPYPPQHHMTTRLALEVIRDHGLAFCTLTKGGARALRDIDLFRPDRDAFASTLTSLDPHFSSKWERGAAEPEDRIDTLKAFNARGIFTWVSLEPTLDVEASLSIVDKTQGFVDLYKVGRVNYIGLTKTTDWQDYTLRMIDKLNQLGKAHYIKKDLQRYLPEGYYNPLRIPQHH